MIRYEAATTPSGVDLTLLTAAVARMLLFGAGGRSFRHRPMRGYYPRFLACPYLGGQTWN